MSIAELKEYRERIRACCANGGGNGGVVGTATLTACAMLEQIPKRFADLSGYKDAVAMNPEFEALCEMIEIDSGFKTSMTPMQKMALCLGTTALSVARQNRLRNAANGGQPAPNPLLASLMAERNVRAQQQAQAQAQEPHQQQQQMQYEQQMQYQQQMMQQQQQQQQQQQMQYQQQQQIQQQQQMQQQQMQQQQMQQQQQQQNAPVQSQAQPVYEAPSAPVTAQNSDSDPYNWRNRGH